MKISKKLFNIFHLFLYCLFLQFQQKAYCQLRKSILGGSNITIKINTIGNQSILYDNCTEQKCGWNYPDKIYLNGISIINKGPYINLTKEENSIILEWFNNLNSTNDMFHDCINIKEIDLSQFDLSQVTRMSAMFMNCYSLDNVIFPNFDTSSLGAIGSLFYNCTSLISLDLSNFNTANLVYSNAVFYNCYNLQSLNLSNFVTEKVTTFSHMFNNCCSLISINFQNLDMTSVNKTINMFCNCSNLRYLNLKNYEEISDVNYSSIFNGVTNLEICFNQSKNPSLIEFINRNKNKLIISKNCFYFYEKYSTAIIYDESYNSNLITDNLTNIYNEKNCELNKNCNIEDLVTNNCINITFSGNNTFKFSDIMKSCIAGGKVQKLLKVKNSIVFSNENNIHQLSQYSFQKDNIDLTSLNLDACKDAIKDQIPSDNIEDLYLYIIEHNLEGINIPILEYILFKEEDIYQDTFINLSICGDSHVKVQTLLKNGDINIDECDPTSDIYKNNCYKQSENGVDLTIYDRKNRFNDKNMSLCEKGCEFIGYNTTIKKVECDCVIKIDMNFNENNSNVGDLVSKIENNQKSKSNIDVVTCDIFSSKENIVTNSGFYLLLFILIIFVIIFIIFCVKGKEKLRNQIDEVIYNYFEKNKEGNNNTTKINNNKSPTNKKIKKINKNNKELNTKGKIKKNIKNINNNKNKDNNTNITSKNKTSNALTKNKIINTKKNKKIPKMNDYELNILPYLDAINYDKRSSCDYYWSLIKNKQLFMFTFCSFTDYNSGVIKKFIFFLSFALHYTINALWFNDSTMHQIYKDEGSFNFKYQYLSILVSALAATVILRIMLETLVLTERSIVKIKLNKNYESAVKMKDNLINNFNIKFAIFFVINFILLVAFWYYLTCFNAIYNNTQVYLIENTLISFAISFFFPIIYNIIPTALRTCALTNEKKDGQYLYSASQIFQII